MTAHQPAPAAAIMMPLHDPAGRLFGHLAAITPQLKTLFSQAYLSVSPPTERDRAAQVQALAADPFFVLNSNAPGSTAGDHFRTGFAQAAAGCAPRQVLHLAQPDRVAYALLTEHAGQFVADVEAANAGALPLLFQRSAAAWATHPRQYREIEQRAIDLGVARFGRYYDFAWSHVVLRAEQLAASLPRLHCRDFGLFAELVLWLRPDLQTQDVDWLAWEDPFIYGRDPEQLRQERDADPAETKKRLEWNQPLYDQVERWPDGQPAP